MAVGVLAALAGIGTAVVAIWKWQSPATPAAGGGATLTPLAVHVPPDAGPPLVMVLPQHDGEAGVHVSPPAAAHPCQGTWRGQLRQSDGNRGTGTVTIDDPHAAQCGTLHERWTTGQVCRYRFSRCAVEGNRIVGRGTTPAQVCPAVRVTMTCQGDRMTFSEDDQTVTVSASLRRDRL